MNLFSSFVSSRRPALAVAAAIAVLAGGPSPANAAPPQTIDVSTLPASVMDDVVVPVPSEIFSVLDKLGNPKWSEHVRREDFRAGVDRAQTALLLGTVIADGFIAVEAMDDQRVKDIGREVLKLSAAIGVRESVLARSNSIIEAADQKDWDAVKRELDGAMQDVRKAMVELRDEQLAQLVSLGGWLRGTDVLTSVVMADYSSDGAELLRQPGLMNYFQRRIDGMSPRLKENNLVVSIRKQLEEIEPLVSTPGTENIEEEVVVKIHGITSELVKSISRTRG